MTPSLATNNDFISFLSPLSVPLEFASLRFGLFAQSGERLHGAGHVPRNGRIDAGQILIFLGLLLCRLRLLSRHRALELCLACRRRSPLGAR